MNRTRKRKCYHKPFHERYAINPQTGCWIWQGSHYWHGYGACSRPLFGEGYAHRWSWAIHHGPIPADMHVLHRCDVRNCVNPDHLFLGTQKDNMDDMRRKNRDARKGPDGEAAHCAVLTDEIVHIIRKDSRPAALLAVEYGVTRGTISKARRGATWKHL